MIIRGRAKYPSNASSGLMVGGPIVADAREAKIMIPIVLATNVLSMLDAEGIGGTMYHFLIRSGLVSIAKRIQKK